MDSELLKFDPYYFCHLFYVYLLLSFQLLYPVLNMTKVRTGHEDIFIGKTYSFHPLGIPIRDEIP